MNLKLDEFIKGQAVLKNIILSGSANNGIFRFIMPKTFFAGGELFAKGVLDFNIDGIDIDFTASNIDANIAAYQVFNIKDHFEGKTNAKLHVAGVPRLNGLKGTGSFEIKDGTVKHIGTTEFVVRRAKKKKPFKFSLSDIVKVSNKIKVDSHSDISGQFNIENNMIKNADIFVQNDLLSLYMEGDYNVDTEYAKLNLWGHYSEIAAREISVFHIPLCFITKFVFKIKETKNTYINKLKKIPAIKADNGNTKHFALFLYGNVNNPRSIKAQFRGVE